MFGLIDRLSRPLMRALDPEDAHTLAIRALRFLPSRGRPATEPPELAVRAFGLNFPNPVGLAAGFDKNAEVPDALLRLGFGFVEVGTVTPLPQGRQPAPAPVPPGGGRGRGQPARLQQRRRCRHAQAAVRRAAGPAALSGSISAPTAIRPTAPPTMSRLIGTFAAVASYLAVNVSSPNTPGLRDLQQARALDDLLARVLDARERARTRAARCRCCSRSRPISACPISTTWSAWRASTASTA